MFFDDHWLLERGMLVIPLVLSITVHEWAHAWSAWMLGDTTAARSGRMTLNPASHVDPIGTLLLPMLGVPFGWAKPVPVNFGNFHRSVGSRSGLFLTAGAGPASNLCLAVICAAILTTGTLILGDVDSLPLSLFELLNNLICINIILAIFNMLPVLPLDGGRIVDCVVTDRLRPLWDKFCSLGPVGLIAIVAVGLLMSPEILAWPVCTTQTIMDDWLRNLSN